MHTRQEERAQLSANAGSTRLQKGITANVYRSEPWIGGQPGPWSASKILMGAVENFPGISDTKFRVWPWLRKDQMLQPNAGAKTA